MDVKLSGSGLILIGLGPGDLGLMTKHAIDAPRTQIFDSWKDTPQLYHRIKKVV